MRERVTILGCPLDAIGAAQATDAIVAFARRGASAQIVTLGTEMVVYAQRDARYRAVIEACALSLCDTVGLLLAARARGAALRERVPGVELIEHLCARLAQEAMSIYLFGGAPGIAQRAARVLAERYPGLRVAGTRDGYFESAQSVAIADEIRASGAHVLFAGIGFPRQEFWLAEHLERTGCGAGMGVGGSFDVISGAVARAPERWRRLGLEWLYRLIKEPARWRRQRALPQFAVLLAADRMRSAFEKRRTTR